MIELSVNKIHSNAALAVLTLVAEDIISARKYGKLPEVRAAIDAAMAAAVGASGKPAKVVLEKLKMFTQKPTKVSRCALQALVLTCS